MYIHQNSQINILAFYVPITMMLYVCLQKDFLFHSICKKHYFYQIGIVKQKKGLY